MKTNQLVLKKGRDYSLITPFLKQDYDFYLAFGAPSFFTDAEIKSHFASTKTPLIGCSTAGEISSEGLTEDSLILTAVKFEHGTTVKTASAVVADSFSALQTGKQLGEQLNDPSLQFVFVLGTGVNINGGDLIRGLEDVLGEDVRATGGLAGDNGAFELTHTALNGNISDNTAVAIGFYGGKIKVGFGSQGGWKPFGPSRKVTKVEGNILYELDGQSALQVYETYLGDKAKDLPASGLLYPFAIVEGQEQENGLIRTILGIDKEKGSLTLAGDVAMGSLLRLMHAGSDSLVDGAEMAASQTMNTAGADSSPGLGLLVSCVGRKLVMGQDTDEEIDAVKDMLPHGSMYTGFYSYGEIGPYEKATCSKLHNQTMTVTFISESA